jgi:hypothetical protein
MARIRSLHPALFTDDRYMALSFAARELIKGIWCEADDQGLFEWKPLTLKARIMPADPIDVVPLLDELMLGQFVSRFEHSGTSYGAVRNFRRFQRPKKPNSIHFMPPEWRTFVGLSADIAEPSPDEKATVPPAPRTNGKAVTHQYRTQGGNSPQM